MAYGVKSWITCLSTKVGTQHISFHETGHRSKIWIPTAALPFPHYQTLRSQSSCCHVCLLPKFKKKKCLRFLHSGWERFQRTVAFSHANGATWGPELLHSSTTVSGQRAAEAVKPFREEELVTAQSLHSFWRMFMYLKVLKSLFYNHVLPPRRTTAIGTQRLWEKTTKSDCI